MTIDNHRSSSGYRITSPDGWVIEATNEAAHQQVLATLALLRECVAKLPQAGASPTLATFDGKALQAWWAWKMAQTDADLASGNDASVAGHWRQH